MAKMEPQAFIRMLNGVKTGNYGMALSELCAIRNYSDDWADTLILAFNYGFLKGQRSVKNTMRKKSMEVSQ